MGMSFVFSGRRERTGGVCPLLLVGEGREGRRIGGGECDEMGAI